MTIDATNGEPLVVAVAGDSLSLPLKRNLRYEDALIDSRDMLVPFASTFPAIIQMCFGKMLGKPVLVTSHTRRGATSTELRELAIVALREYQPHYLILNIGTSDARFRTTGLRRVGGELWQKVPLLEFEENLASLIPAFLCSGATLIAVGILPCSTELLRKYPGTAPEFLRYNTVLKNFTDRVCGIFLDMDDLTSSIDEYVAPDGFHYNAKAHADVARRIHEAMTRDAR